MFLLTGGGSGIGRALAHALADRGKSVLIIGRKEDHLIKTTSYSDLIKYLCADISLHNDRKILVDYLQDLPSISGLINNAGIIEPIAPILEITEQDWQQCMATNVYAPLFLTQLFSDKLINGRVLNIGSGAAYFPVSSWAAYCTSKAALSMLTRCWQMEIDNISFASVMPGIIDTDMQAKIRAADSMDTKKIDFFQQLQANNRLLTPETVASFLTWLLLDISSADYSATEWDIYDVKHHSSWLIAPNIVPSLELP